MKRASGFAGFTVMWSGQMLSTVGTRMTNFAIGISVFQETHSALSVTLLTFVAFGATVAFSPIAGVLIDRWSRRTTIIAADVGSAAVTLALLGVYVFGDPQLWQLYLVNFLTGAFLAFQVPAYGAAITLMIEKGGYTRANAMMGLLRAAPYVAAPAIAAPLVSAFGLAAVLAVDVVSAVVAIVAVYAITLPPDPVREPVTPADGTALTRFRRDFAVGFTYIARRPPLVGLLSIMIAISFLSALGWVLFPPLILARTGDSANAVGIVQVVGAIGGTGAGVLLAMLKPTDKKIGRMLVAILVLGVLGRILFGFEGIWVWSVALFFGWGALPFIDGYNQTIWQEKTPPRLQGRIFAVVQMVENIASPLAYLAAGLLADDLLEPAMRSGGWLASVFGPVTGTGPGSGIAVLFIVSGAGAAVVALVGFLTPAIRNAESLLPDGGGEVEPAPAAPGAAPAR
ncbi:MFS transporter [Amycolatopsis solani]|uniref:MFS transporter n=1 Tax=Amycolatopsis solani TaxID=3028615 RepID=UPI0025B08B43|nr:MFS transporter [Amycolatopsis sp. MEP2-6]